jgi:hypothetical protein
MNTSRTAPPRPIVPSDLPVERSLIRVAAAYVVAAVRGPGERPEAILREFWPRDVAAMGYERTASTPGSIGGWPGAIAVTAVGNFIGSLRDAAASVLIGRGQQIDLTGAAPMKLPHGSVNPGAAWVGEGSVIPVTQGTIDATPSIEPHKLALIDVLTRESFEQSPAGSETWMETILKDSASAALDQSLFSNSAGSATRPPGLVAGITALTASTGTGITAATSDFRALVDAIVAAGGGGEILFFMSRGRAIAAKSLLPALAPQIFGSAQIASGAMLAVAVSAFCSAFGPVPEFWCRAQRPCTSRTRRPRISAPWPPRRWSPRQ